MSGKTSPRFLHRLLIVNAVLFTTIGLTACLDQDTLNAVSMLIGHKPAVTSTNPCQ